MGLLATIAAFFENIALFNWFWQWRWFRILWWISLLVIATWINQRIGGLLFVILATVWIVRVIRSAPERRKHRAEQYARFEM